MSWILTHFVNPGMLAGLALVAAPILIWLFNRVRFRQIEWAAQTFLLRALRRSQKRLRIENFLLLLLRCLVLACFVLALARPRFQPLVRTDETDARRNVVILLDTSYSTSYQIGSDATQTVHEKEKRAAKDLVRQLRPVDRVSIVAFDEQARKVYATPRSVDSRTQREILDEIDSLPETQVTARGTDYAAAFHLLPDVLKRFDVGPDGQPLPSELPPSPKSIFLLSDNQRSGLLQNGALRDPTIKGMAEDVKKLGATIFVVDCGADEPKNAGVVSLETREPIVGTNLPCYIECTVRNFGTVAPARGVKGEALSGLTLEYYIDGADAPVKAVSLDLLPEEVRQLEPLRYVFHDKGAHRVRVSLKSDALQMDNERSLVIDVRDAVEVLLVDGEPKSEKWESETSFLQKALDPYGDASLGKELIHPEVVPEPAFPAGNLRKYDLIVLANIVSLPDDHVAALETYAREGGAVVFAMGGLIDRDHYNDKLWRHGTGIFPCSLGDVKGTTTSDRPGDRDPNAAEWVFALADAEHPALSVFAEEDMKPILRTPSVYRFIEAKDLTVATDKGRPTQAAVPLRFVPRPPDIPESSGTGAKPAEMSHDQVLEGAPALVEKAFGRGRVSAYLTSLGWHRDQPWTNTVSYPMYVVLWRQLALELARSSRPKRNIMIGDRFERVIDEYAKTVEVIDPLGNKEAFRPENLEGRDQYLIVFPPTAETRVGPAGSSELARAPDSGGVDKPGLYEVRLTGGAGDSVPPPSDWFAVRVDPSEGDVNKLDLDDWKEQLPGLDVRRAQSDSLGDAFQVSGGSQQGDELWPHALTFCIAFLAIESLLAAMFGRRRQ